MLFLLLWLLAGSIGLNFMWIETAKCLVIDDKYSWKKEKYKYYNNSDYLGGVFFGLLFGPITLLLGIESFLGIGKNNEKN